MGIGGSFLLQSTAYVLHKALNITNRWEVRSLVAGVALLRDCDASIDAISDLRKRVLPLPKGRTGYSSHTTAPASLRLWTNQDVCRWLISVLKVDEENEAQFRKAMSETGLHGAVLFSTGNKGGEWDEALDLQQLKTVAVAAAKTWNKSGDGDAGAQGLPGYEALSSLRAR